MSGVRQAFLRRTYKYTLKEANRYRVLQLHTVSCAILWVGRLKSTILAGFCRVLLLGGKEREPTGDVTVYMTRAFGSTFPQAG